ncbi:MAG: hypothetical protein ACLR4Z_00845 [Butyricicoccaceae bacterium]
MGDAAARQRKTGLQDRRRAGDRSLPRPPEAKPRACGYAAAALQFSKRDTERILLLVEQHDRPLGDSEKLVRRSLARLGEARFRDLLMIKRGCGRSEHAAVGCRRAVRDRKMLNRCCDRTPVCL